MQSAGSFTDYLTTSPAAVAPFGSTIGINTANGYCYNAGINPYGYFASIIPKSNASNIKVQIRIQYQASPSFGTRLTIGVVYAINGVAGYNLLGQDILNGTNNASGPLITGYTFNFMHNPNTTSQVTYYVFYQLENSTSSSVGLIGTGTSSASNCIILEEYAAGSSNAPGSFGATGPTGPTGAPSGVVIQYQFNKNLTTSNYLTTLTTEQTATDYNSIITPQNIASNILVNFKVKYQTSYAANTYLTMTIKRAPGPAYSSYTTISQDTLLGSGNGVGLLYNIYTANMIDSPATTTSQKYQLFFTVVDGSGNLAGSSGLGVLGSAGNCIFLQEMLGSGTIANVGLTGPTGPGPTTTGSGSSTTSVLTYNAPGGSNYFTTGTISLTGGSAISTFVLSGISAYAKMTLIVYNGASASTIAPYNTSPYHCSFTSTLSIPANKWAILNVNYDGTNYYIDANTYLN